MGEGGRVTHVLRGWLLHWSLQFSHCRRGKMVIGGSSYVKASPRQPKLGKTLT